MCCGENCLFFINVRIGSLIFGYIIAVLSGAITLGCTITALFCIIHMTFCGHGDYVVLLNVITPFLIEFLSSFVCSVLLIVGITKNKLSFIKTYVAYGMIQILLLETIFIIMHCITNFFNSGFVLLGTTILGLYGLCLYMIFLTYKTMAAPNGHVNQPDVERLNA